MAISLAGPEAISSLRGIVATSTVKALKYVNDLTGKLDPVQWTFSMRAKGIGLVKNSVGKIFASVKDGKFTCRVLKDGARY
ncbi:MAG: hypothetical protein Q8903_15445 [Bacteroidota bacterium]|nr:hypothetical protein [Bacteroidota bacterium]